MERVLNAEGMFEYRGQLPAYCYALSLREDLPPWIRPEVEGILANNLNMDHQGLVAGKTKLHEDTFFPHRLRIVIFRGLTTKMKTKRMIWSVSILTMGIDITTHGER